MSFEEAGFYCATCGRERLFRRESCNNVLHLLITVLLCGCWLPVWMLLACWPSSWYCTTCGHLR